MSRLVAVVLDSVTLALMAVGDVVRSCVLALVTPLLEKNPVKTLGAGWLGSGVALVFSMTRLIVLAFAVGVLHQIWRGGVHGWPEATLAVAIVLALPILGALDRVRPHEVIALAESLVARFGVGDVGGPAVVAPIDLEPSKYDDHRWDAGESSGGGRRAGVGAGEGEAA